MILDYQQNNNLFRSPVHETAQNILNVGTGGGVWIEQLEPNTKVWCDDGTLQANAVFVNWGDILEPAFAASGKRIDTEEKMRARIEAAGYINVHEKI